MNMQIGRINEAAIKPKKTVRISHTHTPLAHQSEGITTQMFKSIVHMMCKALRRLPNIMI